MPEAFQALLSCTQATTEIKRSRFIAHLLPLQDKADVSRQVATLRNHYPDARHHCFAYVLGNPHQAQAAGFNDAGEPAGTAGKPMLNVLMKHEVGNVLAVVVRYFGGIKLGAGGLVRAYAQAVSAALATAELGVIAPQSHWRIDVPFALEDLVRDLLNKAGGVVVTGRYSDVVSLVVACSSKHVATLQATVRDATGGLAQFTPTQREH